MAFFCTHELSQKMHVVLFDPVAENFDGRVAFGEDQLDKTSRLLLR